MGEVFSVNEYICEVAHIQLIFRKKLIISYERHESLLQQHSIHFIN